MTHKKLLQPSLSCHHQSTDVEEKVILDENTTFFFFNFFKFIYDSHREREAET